MNQTTQMKAIIFHKYRSIDSLELIEIEKPSPKEDEVLEEGL